MYLLSSTYGQLVQRAALGMGYVLTNPVNRHTLAGCNEPHDFLCKLLAKNKLNLFNRTGTRLGAKWENIFPKKEKAFRLSRTRLEVYPQLTQIVENPEPRYAGITCLAVNNIHSAVGLWDPHGKYMEIQGVGVTTMGGGTQFRLGASNKVHGMSNLRCS